MSRQSYLLPVLFVAAAAATRLIDHPWNVVPIGAIALFAGCYFRNRTAALCTPIAAMILGDVGLGFLKHNHAFYTFHPLVPVIYGCYLASVLLGMGVGRNWRAQSRAESAGSVSRTSSGKFLHRVLPLGVATLAGSLLFFVVTNFGVWAVYNTYTKDLAGLTECYVAAIPFFRNTIAGDVFFVTALFGGYELLKHALPALDEEAVAELH